MNEIEWAMGLMDGMSERQLREEIHRLVEVVGAAYLEDMRYVVQQYAAKSLNEAMEDRKHKIRS